VKTGDKNSITVFVQHPSDKVTQMVERTNNKQE